MWITSPGRINKNLEFLGTYELCLYRIEAGDALIAGGGMMHIVPILMQQIAAHDKAAIPPSKLIIQHSHADHCGAVPFLKQFYPGMEILASRYTSELLHRDKVIKHIALSNKRAVDFAGMAAECAELSVKCDRLEVERTVKDGDIIDLGEGIEACIIEVAGHTRCSIAVYIPALKMLFPSDAVPVPSGDIHSLQFKPSPQYNYRLYLQSLERLAALDFDVMALEHHGVFTGSHARTILQKGIEETEKMREYILLLYTKQKDLEKTAVIYLDKVMKNGLLSFIERDVAMAAARAEVRSVLRDAGLV